MEPPTDINIVIEVLGKRFNLDNLRIEDFPPEIFQWELGGITDPVGQISGWLWGQITTALNVLEADLRSAFAFVLGKAQDFLAGLINTLSYAVNNLPGLINAVSSGLSTLHQVISGTLGTITGALTTLGANIQGLYSGVQNIIGRISEFAAQIGGTVSGLIGDLKGWLSNAVASIATTMGSLATAIATISTTVHDLFGNFSGAITSIVTGIGKIGGTISTAFQGFTGFLTSIGQALAIGLTQIYTGLQTFATTVGTAFQGVETFLGTIGQGIATGFTQVYTFLQTVGTGISTAVGGLITQLEKLGQGLAGVLAGIGTTLGSWGGQLWQGLLGLKDWLTTSFKDFWVYLQNVGQGVWTFIQNVPKYWSDFWAWMEGGWNAFKTDLGGWWNGAYAWMQGAWKDVQQGVGEVKVTLMGFINPLVGIGQTFNTLSTAISTFIKDPVAVLKGMFKIGFEDVYNYLHDEVMPTVMNDLKTAYDWLSTGAQDLWAAFSGIMTPVFNTAFKGLDLMNTLVDTVSGDVTDWFNKSMASWLFVPFSAIPLKLFNDYKAWRKKGVAGTIPDPSQLLLNLGGYIMGSVTSPYLVSALMRWAGSNMKGKVSIDPFGVGADIKIDIGSLFLHLSKIVWKIPDVLLNSLGYGLGIWIWQPTARLINSMSRNALPIRMPNMAEIREIANRASETGTLKQIQGTLATFLSYYGYADWSIGWMLGSDMASSLGIKATEFGELNTKISDRFGAKVDVPLALRYRMPSPRELSTMMIHSIFPKFDYFTSMMSIGGMAPDVARLYYFSHYQYPKPELLWSFYRRAMSGMLWYQSADTTYPEKAAGVGLDPTNPDELNYNDALISTMIDEYMKWNDFAPFAWAKGFPADRDLIVDIMAQIPERRDASRMFKWGLIGGGTTDAKIVQSVFNIVRGTGTHPDWEQVIATNECLNALTDEKVYARSGILQAYESGFLKKADADSELSIMATIKILGVDTDIVNIEGERELLLFRHLWDKALNVVRGAWRYMVTGFTRNMISKTDGLTQLQAISASISSVLKIKLTVDDTYLTAAFTALEKNRDFATIQRVRSWMRIFVYRASQLAESGEEFAGVVSDYVATALLTPLEQTIITDLGQRFFDVAQRKKLQTQAQNKVKGQLQSGQIVTADAIAQLVKAGLTQDEAVAFLDSAVKPRVVSIDKLISMRNQIPIALDTLKRKMDAEGVPADEQALYMPFAIANELSSEVNKLATELVDEYVAGQLTDDQLKTEFDGLATLYGQASTVAGVPWVCLAPEERQLLILLAQKRKARKLGGTTTITTPTKVYITTDKLTSMSQELPITAKKFTDTMNAQGIPPDDQSLYSAYAIAEDVKSEINRFVTELLTDYENNLLSDTAFSAMLDNLATFNGQAKSLIGVDWIVLSPLSRGMLLVLAKIRKARKQKQVIG